MFCLGWINPDPVVIGTWAGQVDQEDYAGSYSVCLTVKELNFGEVSGTIFYEELDCGGVLTYYGAVNSEDGNSSHVFVEKISKGEFRCANGGTVTLLWNKSRSSYDFYWNSANFPNSSCTSPLQPADANCLITAEEL